MREDLKKQYDTYRSRISSIEEEDDPLAVYYEFVQWTINNSDPKSELTQLLKDATKAFETDATYKTDLRYLKLWIQYARYSNYSALSVCGYLYKHGIGTSYSLLYEEYANALEKDKKIPEAKAVYQKGIDNQARPIERLKSKYASFCSRNGSSSSSLAVPSSSSSSKKSSKQPSSPPAPSTAEARYAVMLAPPPPGKRPEKLNFDFSLLYSKENGEYCIEEARTKSIGLLRKKWPILPPQPPTTIATTQRDSSSSQEDEDDSMEASRTVIPRRKSMFPEPAMTRRDSSSSQEDEDDPMEANRTVISRRKSMFPEPAMTRRDSSSSQEDEDDSMEANRTVSSRRKSMFPEPTMTINTREALNDVFGMYNSPERTTKMGAGSKHIPVKRVSSIGAGGQSLKPMSTVSENSSGFQPFIDENANSTVKRKENKPAPFAPFVDPESSKKSAPASRAAFTIKQVPHQTQTENENNKEKKRPLGETKVFAPEPRPAQETQTPQAVFTPFLDENSGAPFKVFSRPTEKESVFTPKERDRKAFAPLKEQKSPFVPFQDSEPEPSRDQQQQVGYEEEQSEEYDEDYDDEGDFVADLPPEEDEEVQGEGEYEDGYLHEEREVPLGGRFGKFTVMTPITERTFEYTTTRSMQGSPSAQLKHIPENPEEEMLIREEEEADETVREDEDNEEEEDSRRVPFKLPTDVTKEESSGLGLSGLEESTGRLTLAESLSRSTSFRPPNPCNPFDPPIISTLLSTRVHSDKNFIDLRDRESGTLGELEKFAKKSRKLSGTRSSGDMADMPSRYTLNLAGQKFTVLEKLGEGGFGSVFKAKDKGAANEDEDDDDDDDDLDLDDSDSSSLVALKVVKPRNLWEYHILRRIHTALASSPSCRRSIILPHALYAFKDESFLVLDYCSQGSLLDIVNGAEGAGVSQQGACLDELLVMFFTIELIRVLEGLHNAGFIHGDLKIDNCLLRLEELAPSEWASNYSPSGEGGWSAKGLELIDFGRTIDTKLFPSNQQFIAEWETDERDCFEIREGRPWTYQTDYFGLLSIVYCMFWGKYIGASCLSKVGGRYKVVTPLKRYWQTELWGRLFDVLLNPGEELPITSELGEIRKEMEEWLMENCNRTSGTLKGLLRKVEMYCLQR